jgi:hypothetical protein
MAETHTAVSGNKQEQLRPRMVTQSSVQSYKLFYAMNIAWVVVCWLLLFPHWLYQSLVSKKLNRSCIRRLEQILITHKTIKEI